MPATAQHRRMAVGVVVLLIVAAAIIAPFASIQVARIDAFIPVLQTVVCVVDLITAVLLFAQFSIQPQPALLALASAYIFSGSFAFLQTLAFPGGYAPAGLIGDGPNTPTWIYVLWHTTFPAAILAYPQRDHGPHRKGRNHEDRCKKLPAAPACSARCEVSIGSQPILGSEYLRDQGTARGRHRNVHGEVLIYGERRRFVGVVASPGQRISLARLCRAA
jgi:hypothetical protein